jgi:glycosyltransferase involved in cell wall biosynthesis
MPEVCVVIPCFNEASRLRGDEILEFLRSHEQVTICFVDDGSSDGTRATLEGVRAQAPQAVQVLVLPVNGGKAEAVRQGVLHAAASHRFALIGYWDADLSTPLRELPALLRAFEANPSCTLAMGARVRRLGSNIRRSASRHYVGRVFSTVASLLLKLPVYDSQCGAKVVRADFVDVLFGDPFLTKWIFDVEILARLRNYLGPAPVLGAVSEVPLMEWSEVGGSKLRFAHMVKVPLELMRISAHYQRTTGARRVQ